MAAVRTDPEALPAPGPRLLAHGVPRVLVVATAVVILLGTIASLVPAAPAVVALLHLDAEGGIPALYSALLLLTAGVLGFLLRGYSTVFAVLGLGLAVMAADEVLMLHEHLEGGTDTDWQLLYAPVVALAAPVLLRVLTRVRAVAPAAALVLAGGFGCWVLSQVLEALQWDGDRPVAGYLWLMVVEESLEMVGTLGVLLALHAVARRVWPGARPTARRPRRP